MATQAELAAHLDLSDRSIRELLDKGVLPNARRGALDLDACRVAYLRHLREIAAGRATGPSGDELTSERARLAREQADGVALRNAALRKELLPRGEVNRAVVTAFTIVRDRLTALPARLAGPLARLTDAEEVRGRLAESIAAVLGELAEERVVAATEGTADDD